MQTELRPLIPAVAGIPGVVAISLGGSSASGLADHTSDLDLYIYWRTSLAAPQARADRLLPIADPGSVEVELMTWGREDHLALRGRKIELIYVPLDDLRGEVDRAYADGLMSEGYTTARLYWIANGHPLHDPSGEWSVLYDRLRHEFPEPTRRRLLAELPGILRFVLAELRRGQARADFLYAQSSRSQIQMIFFDLLFAINRLYHPGSKRLLIHAERCVRLPSDCAARWIQCARLSADDPKLAIALEALIEDLCRLIEDTQ